MQSPSSRSHQFWARCLAVAIAVYPAAAVAQAVDPDPGTGTSVTGLTKADFEIRLEKKVGDKWIAFNATDADTFFNRARCQCDEQLLVRVRLLASGMAKVRAGKRAEFRLRAGDQTCVCTGANCANLNCKDIDTPRDLNALINGGLEFITTVRAIFEAGRPATSDANAVCSRDEMQNLWLWMDSDDAGADTELTDVSFPLRLDGVAPGAPTGLKVTPGNEALEVSWDALDYLDDLQGYIIFCSRGEDTSVFPGTFKPDYTTPANLCPGQAQSLTQATVTGTSHALVGDVPAGGARGFAPARLAALDPEFVCSDIITGGRAERRLFQLQNGIPYVVGVASVDRRGNASAIENVVLQVPIPTRDFYRNYRQDGGSAEGGFCSVSRGRDTQAARWLVLALCAPLVVLAARRSRRGRRL